MEEPSIKNSQPTTQNQPEESVESSRQEQPESYYPSVMPNITAPVKESLANRIKNKPILVGIIIIVIIGVIIFLVSGIYLIFYNPNGPSATKLGAVSSPTSSSPQLLLPQAYEENIATSSLPAATSSLPLAPASPSLRAPGDHINYGVPVIPIVPAPAKVIESFDNLNLGELSGQNGWTGSSGIFSVENTVVAGGPGALIAQCKNPCPTYQNMSIYKVDPIATSTVPIIITVFFRVDTPLPGPVTGVFRQRGTIAFRWLRNIGNGDLVIASGPVAVTTPFVSLTSSKPMALGHWYKLDFQVDIANQQVRARMDNDVWSRWLKFVSNISQITNVKLIIGGFDAVKNDITAYFDDFSWQTVQ